ncbi:MAG: class I tRNA ligase family protein, partial [Thermoplasmataceae archaeon]
EMICTFGDQNDVAVWRKHSLQTRVIIDRFGKLTEEAGILSGLKVKDARKKILSVLSQEGLVVKLEKIRHSVNVHERCNTPVEIGISKQWFVKYLDIKEELLKFDSQINWIPSHMRVRLQNWITGLKWDWCISRQRFLGVPFPVWYCKKCGEVNLAPDEAIPIDPRTEPAPSGMVCKKCGGSDFVPESDVMDTWATSSLSPRLAFRGRTGFESIKPFDCRFQGHDIISFWAFTTIVRSYIHDNTIPWRDIVISGNVYDAEGIKMSKSKGNVVEPEDIIAKYGADALRYWASTTAMGEDIKLKEQDLVRGRRTVIKIFNAARLVKTLTGSYPDSDNEERNFKFPWNVWITTLLNDLVGRTVSLMDNYEFSKARTDIDTFFWNDYCDNYLEISKVVMGSDAFSSEEKEETARCLRYTMFSAVKMYSPIMPFITEEIYHDLGGKMASVSIDTWPEAHDLSDSEREIANKFGEVIRVIGTIRALKSARKVSMAAPLDMVVIKGNGSIIMENERIIRGVMRISHIKVEESEEVDASVA